MLPVPTPRTTTSPRERIRGATGSSRRAKKSAATKSDTPGPTVVLLVRHGVTPRRARSCREGPRAAPRTRGARQADAVAARIASLSRRPSPSTPRRSNGRRRRRSRSRGARTARDHDRGLLECDFGEWTGKELAALSKLPAWNTVQRWPSGFTFPGGESFAAMSTRISATVARIAAAHAGQTVVAVSHADPIKAAVAWPRRAARPLPALRGLALLVSAVALSPAVQISCA